jgi:prephenate dehydrogenase
VIGVGLIGGSLARALRAAGVCDEVIGCGRGEANLKRAQDLGVIDRYERDPGRAVEGADMVVLCVPLGAMYGILTRIAGHLSADAVVTDAGSVKGCVVEDVRRAFNAVPANFVPAHPIAGTEKSGVEASFAELFRDHMVILTPLRETASEASQRVSTMWKATGARIVNMEVEHHDQVLAATSHLPHLLAFSLVDTLARMGDREEIFRYAAGGFRDFTRVASSDPQMWHDICVANREPLLEVLQRFRDRLDDLADALNQNDGGTLLQTFGNAKRARDTLYQE